MVLTDPELMRRAERGGVKWLPVPLRVEAAYCESERHAGDRVPAVWCHLLYELDDQAAGDLVIVHPPWLSCDDCRAAMQAVPP